LPDTTTSQIIKQGSFQAFADMAYPSGSMVNEFDDVDLALAANEDLNDVGFLDSTGAALPTRASASGWTLSSRTRSETSGSSARSAARAAPRRPCTSWTSMTRTRRRT
jgi:hypothetical protein